MHLLAGSADCQNLVLTFHPRNGCHDVLVVLGIKKLLYLSSNCVPKIYSLREADRQNVIRAPVQEIQIVIVNQVWSIEDLLRKLRDAAHCLLLVLSFFISNRLNQREVLLQRH